MNVSSTRYGITVIVADVPGFLIRIISLILHDWSGDLSVTGSR